MPPRKRQAAPLTPGDAGRRRSARTSLSGKKSIYFEGDSSDGDVSSDAGAKKRKRGKPQLAVRGGPRRRVDGEDSDGDVYEEEDDEEEEDDDDDDEVRNGNGVVKSEDGDEDEDADVRPKVTFIPKKQLRDLGGVEYTDETVHPVTLQFLRDLKANNRRDWLKDNDAEFRRAQTDWLSFVGSLDARLRAADATLPEVPAKDHVFRIYRDVRFSRDPRPYKAHFSAAWSRGGKTGPFACYYVHCEPGVADHAGGYNLGACFVGGGIWNPGSEVLGRLRRSLDERPERWRRVMVEDDQLRATFLAVAGRGKGKPPPTTTTTTTSPPKAGDEQAIKAALAAMNAENALKKKPLGYAADHREIELLKLRNFTVQRRIDEALFSAPDGQAQIAAMLQALVPFVAHLNRTAMPDAGHDDDSD